MMMIMLMVVVVVILDIYMNDLNKCVMQVLLHPLTHDKTGTQKVCLVQCCITSK